MSLYCGGGSRRDDLDKDEDDSHHHYKNLRLYQEGSRALALSFPADPPEEQWLWWCQLKHHASCSCCIQFKEHSSGPWLMSTNAPFSSKWGILFLLVVLLLPSRWRMQATSKRTAPAPIYHSWLRLGIVDDGSSQRRQRRMLTLITNYKGIL